ncbi:MAG: hypothetical protein EXQ91_03600 [Alphaproteobacteria bacterium]|nr:hypothetical protein [Alphaproteobacteria bacterium]
MTISPINHNIDNHADLVRGVESEPKQSAFLNGRDELSFEDFLDLINPLQHIPVVSTIYRALTDDTISRAARLADGALYGGPLGFASSLANLVIEDMTVRDIDNHVLALDGFDQSPTPASIAAVMAPTVPDADPAATVIAPVPPFPTSTASGSEERAGRAPVRKPFHQPLPLPSG